MWTIGGCSESRRFSCDGENIVPCEFVDLLDLVADVGLPLAWSGHEMIQSMRGDG